ncbi:MAG: hypothetical protein KC414_03435 [Romboutsia sp.]|nr:hypothetical protein [Romboutsia sp.]
MSFLDEMKVIFLDIDGVLNHELWFKRSGERPKSESRKDFDLEMIDPQSVNHLNTIIEKTGAKVVISSLQRKHFILSGRKVDSVEYLQELLDEKGFIGEIIGKTNYIFYDKINKLEYTIPRGYRVKDWFNRNKYMLEIEEPFVKYVIVDSDILDWGIENYFRTDPYCGITANVAYRIVNFLNK